MIVTSQPWVLPFCILCRITNLKCSPPQHPGEGIILLHILGNHPGYYPPPHPGESPQVLSSSTSQAITPGIILLHIRGIIRGIILLHIPGNHPGYYPPPHPRQSPQVLSSYTSQGITPGIILLHIPGNHPKYYPPPHPRESS